MGDERQRLEGREELAKPRPPQTPRGRSAKSSPQAGTQYDLTEAGKRWQYCLETVNDFYRRWRELLAEIHTQRTRLEQVLPRTEVEAFYRRLSPNAVTPSGEALREVVRRLEEFSAAESEFSSPTETPVERKARVDAFCERHRCTRAQIYEAAQGHRSDFAKWQACKKHGPDSKIAKRIEEVLQGKRRLASCRGRDRTEWL